MREWQGRPGTHPGPAVGHAEPHQWLEAGERSGPDTWCRPGDSGAFSPERELGASQSTDALSRGLDLHNSEPRGVAAHQRTPLGWASRPLLTAEQEVGLAKRIEAGVLAAERLDSGCPIEPRLARELAWIAADGATAKTHLIEANVRLVEHFAIRFLGRGLEWDDVVQEGMLGLIHAVEMFDYTRGVKFSTYAANWIKQAVRRAVGEKGRTIRLPAHVHEELARVRIAAERASTGRGLRGTDEVAAAAGVSVARLNELRLEALPVLSLEMPWPNRDVNAPCEQLDDGFHDTTALGDVIVEVLPMGTDSPGPLISALRLALEQLPERDRDVLLLRAGVVHVDGRYVSAEPLTLQQVADRYGRTRERIRQIESRVTAGLASRLGALLDTKEASS